MLPAPLFAAAIRRYVIDDYADAISSATLHYAMSFRLEMIHMPAAAHILRRLERAAMPPLR